MDLLSKCQQTAKRIYFVTLWHSAANFVFQTERKLNLEFGGDDDKDNSKW